MRVVKLLENERFVYYMTEDSDFIRITKKSGKEKKLSKFMFNGNANVCFDGQARIVKYLMVEHFLQNYLKPKIEFIDGNELNCSLKNMIVKDYIYYEDVCYELNIAYDAFRELKIKLGIKTRNHIFEDEYEIIKQYVDDIRAEYGRVTLGRVCRYFREVVNGK